MNCGVPKRYCFFIGSTEVVSYARPKSMMLIWNLSSMSILPGLMSRCTILLACMWVTPLMIMRISCLTSSTGSKGVFWSQSLAASYSKSLKSRECCTYSVTMYMYLLSSNDSTYLMMFVWSIIESTVISSRIISRARDDIASFKRTLTAYYCSG